MTHVPELDLTTSLEVNFRHLHRGNNLVAFGAPVHNNPSMNLGELQAPPLPQSEIFTSLIWECFLCCPSLSWEVWY